VFAVIEINGREINYPRADNELMTGEEQMEQK
jgi:hypothetical protein